MKNKFFIVGVVTLFVISVALLLYPTASQLINKIFNNSTIVQYNNQVSVLDTNEKVQMIKEAEEYNANLSNVVTDSFSPDAFNVTDEYKNILNVTADGLIGTINIPTINCNLPIYHGTSENALTKGAVHMANTSFPIGGESTHAVISAHTAYPGKVFFDKLTEVTYGDFFYVKVLDKTYAYQVCQIDVVLPNDTRLLKVSKGNDYVTLITCTPYSVNTHRLLVRGERNLEEEARLAEVNIEKSTDIPRTPYVRVYICIGAVFVTALLIILFMVIKKKKRKKNESR